MLKNIPFYSSLLGRELIKGVRAANSHVLVYGAIEVHAMGERGCIASNSLLGDETGLTESTVAKVVSQLKAAGWITTELTVQNKRLSITPMLEISALPQSKAALPQSNAELYPEVKIDNRVRKQVKEIDKSISKKVEKEPYTEKDVEMSTLLRELASERHPYLKMRKPGKSHLRIMNKIHAQDGYDYATIEAVIRWATQDDFWSGVIQSEQGLHRNFNKLLVSAERWHKEKQRSRIGKI